jgi:hypothetical protein
VETYLVGERVTHDRFGMGRVISADAAAVVVDFGAERVRVVSPFTRLSKL